MFFKIYKYLYWYKIQKFFYFSAIDNKIFSYYNISISSKFSKKENLKFMSRARYELKSPEKFFLKLNPAVANRLRRYCAENQFIVGKFIEELVIESLVGNGVVSRIVLDTEIMETEE